MLDYLQNKEKVEFLSVKRESTFKENSATVIIEYDENDYVTEKEEIQSAYGNGEYIDYGIYGKRLDGFEYKGYRFIYINRQEPPFPQSLMLIGTNDGEQKIAFVCYRNTTDENPFFDRKRGLTGKQITERNFLEQNCGWRKLKTRSTQ